MNLYEKLSKEQLLEVLTQLDSEIDRILFEKNYDEDGFDEHGSKLYDNTVVVLEDARILAQNLGREK